MFVKEAKHYANKWLEEVHELELKGKADPKPRYIRIQQAFEDGAESTLRKVIKYFSTIVLDENCGGYFSRLLESEEKLQELAKELENV